MIRVLVVDDSAVLRQSTKFILESDPELRVVGEASNGVEAVTLVDRLRPDVITMDIRMPKLDGLEAIREIMAEHPVPIVVLTGLDLDREGDIAVQATGLGAVAVLRRPEVAAPSHPTYPAKLIQQVKAMSAVKVVRRTRSQPIGVAEAGVTRSVPLPSPPCKTEIVAIGSSTGGPAALHQVLSGMPAGFPVPIVVVQHISFGFVGGLASWLNDASPLRVKIGEQGERLQPGVAYIAPDNCHLLVDKFKKIGLSTADPVGLHRPAVTALFQSVAQAYGPAAMAVILTGMGADGAVGMKSLRQAGAITIAQDEASSVVFGMPKEAIALGAIQHVVPLNRMAQAIQELIVV